MPKSFDPLCKKMYYPHFNTASNMNYVGPYPEHEFYGIDFIYVDERAQFLEWHRQQNGVISKQGRTAGIMHGRR